MLERLKKIFGLQAAPPAPPQPPPPTPPPPTPPPPPVVAKPPQRKNVWRLNENGNAAGLAEAIAADPTLLVGRTKQVNIGKKGSITLTPMLYAAYKGAKAAVKILHEAGVDIDAKGDQGLTPLHLAARCKSGAGVVAYILSCSTATVNAQCDSGATPLIEAARQGNNDGVKALLRHGASVNITAKYAMPAIVAAAACGHGAVVDMLLAEGAPLETKNDAGRTALWYAAYANHASLAAALIDRGADMKVKDTHGTTLLMAAARLGNIDLAQLLVKEGLNVNDRDTNGCTAMHYTCMADGGARTRAVAELLISNGAYIDVRDNRQEMPIDFARRIKSQSQPHMIEFFQAQLDNPASPRDPGFLLAFTEGTEQRVKAMRALKLKPAGM